MSVGLPELVKSLSVAFDARDYASCEKLLPPIKIELIKHNVFLPDLHRKSEPQYVADLNITKHILEIGALTAIYTSDFESYQNYFTQLRMFYFTQDETLSTSDNKSKLISLYLLILLAQGDVTKFHSELQYLDKHVANLEQDELLSYPIKVDRWLMEGSYSKAWNLLETGLKVPEFDVFSKTLMNAIRDEIAHSTELAYSQLPLSNIKTLLFFNTEKNAELFAQERGWIIKNGNVVFQRDPVAENEITSNDTPQFNFIEKTLDYAINLESIV